MIKEAIFFITNFIIMYILLRKLEPRFRQKKTVKAVMYLNSIAHGILIFAASSAFLTKKMGIAEYNTYIEMTKGYLLQDIIVMCYFYKYIDGFFLMLFHHVIFFASLFSNFIAIYPYLLAQALTCEVTNFFLYGGWFLIQLGLDRTFIFIMNAVILITLFFYFRVYNFLNLFLIAIDIENAHLESSVLFFISFMNVYWFVLLVEKFIKLLIFL